MFCTLATDHVYNICNNFFGTEERAIHPTSSLLHQDQGRRWCIGKGLSIRHVSELICAVDLDVDSQAHDSIFSEILVGFSTSRLLRSSHIFEKGIEWTALDSIPTENRVRTRQHLGEAKERLACFVRSVAHLVLKELGSLHQVRTYVGLVVSSLTWTSVCWARELFRSCKIDFNLSATSATIFICLHVIVEF